jgi:lipoate-protein ligase A
VEELNCRLLSFQVADGPTNMATDEALLSAASGGVATLRFYGWTEATLSLGYFQSAQVRLADPLLAQLPFVRRPSGGDTLVHHHELTYALGMPPAWRGHGPWLVQMHKLIATALQLLGIAVSLFEPTVPTSFEGPLCFHHFAPGDVLLDSRKVVGSAQRQRRGAVVQHGAILLRQSPYTPSLKGIGELTGVQLDIAALSAAIVGSFAQALPVRIWRGDLTDSERSIVAVALENKYRSPEWNSKR